MRLCAFAALCVAACDGLVPRALVPGAPAHCARRSLALSSEAVQGRISRGSVSRVEAYGAFVKLEDSTLSGLVHSSEGGSSLAVGEPVYVRVVRADASRLSLSTRGVDQRTGKFSEPAPLAPSRGPSSKVRLATLEDCSLAYARSGGAGGQNVNKVETKCEVRIDLAGAVAAGLLTPAGLAKLRLDEKNRINKKGELVLASEVHRTQRLNAADALQRLRGLLANAERTAVKAQTAPDRAKRIKSLARSADRGRLDDKKRDGKKKQNRRSNVGFD